MEKAINVCFFAIWITEIHGIAHGICKLNKINEQKTKKLIKKRKTKCMFNS